MNANCEQIEGLVQECLDRELTGVQEAALRQHLQDCPTCRATFQPLLEMIRQVERAPAIPVPAGLCDRVLAALPAVQATEPVLPGRFVIRLGWITAAAAAVLLAVLWPAGQLSGPTNRPPTIASRGPAIDPIAATCLAAVPYTLSNGPQGALLALAGARLAQQSRQVAPEPMRIVVCMATPAARDEQPGPPISDVIQMISNRAALHGGL